MATKNRRIAVTVAGLLKKKPGSKTALGYESPFSAKNAETGYVKPKRKRLRGA